MRYGRIMPVLRSPAGRLVPKNDQEWQFPFTIIGRCSTCGDIVRLVQLPRHISEYSDRIREQGAQTALSHNASPRQ